MDNSAPSRTLVTHICTSLTLRFICNLHRISFNEYV
jgi:hypothetical protein